jgi:hypothetical protein
LERKEKRHNFFTNTHLFIMGGRAKCVSKSEWERKNFHFQWYSSGQSVFAFHSVKNVIKSNLIFYNKWAKECAFWRQKREYERDKVIWIYANYDSEYPLINTHT